MAHLYIVLILCFTLAGTFAADPSENDDLFEGDMELRPEQKLDIELSTAGVPTFGSSTYPSWPKEIAYAMHPDIARESKAVDAINQAIADYHKYSAFDLDQEGMEMKPISTLYQDLVGYWRQPNNIKLAPGCWYKGIVMHEMMHSLGFYHEQSRPDRDSYVTINWQNIPKKNKHNFLKYDGGRINSMNSPYDYDSVMHYGRYAFGGRRVTIEPKDANARGRIGQRQGFSRQDIYQLNKRYKC